MKKSQTFTGRIRPDLKVKLTAWANEESRSLNNLLEIILSDYVSRREVEQRKRGRSSATQATP